MRRLYLAGPDVFLPDGRAVLEEKARACASQGFEATHALCADLEVDVETHPKPLVARAIFEANRAMIADCDAVLANLTPFRGPSADAGTVWEIGFAAGLGKTVIGYSGDPRPFAERARSFVAAQGDGCEIEDFDLIGDNLMIDCALSRPILTHAGDLAAMAAFALALAALEG